MTVLEKRFEENNVEMTEAQFWGLVDSIEWAEVSLLEKYDRDGIRKSLERILTEKGIRNLRMIANIAWDQLDAFVGNERNPAGGGDDSHGDLLNHIIGLGKEAYYNHLNDYRLIEARGQAKYQTAEGYRESFSYCLPRFI
jgi:hypothetical protein